MAVSFYVHPYFNLKSPQTPSPHPAQTYIHSKLSPYQAVSQHMESGNFTRSLKSPHRLHCPTSCSCSTPYGWVYLLSFVWFNIGPLVIGIGFGCLRFCVHGHPQGHRKHCHSCCRDHNLKHSQASHHHDHPHPHAHYHDYEHEHHQWRHQHHHHHSLMAIVIIPVTPIMFKTPQRVSLNPKP